jgi:hypothetical protein
VCSKLHSSVVDILIEWDRFSWSQVTEANLSSVETHWSGKLELINIRNELEQVPRRGEQVLESL